MSELMYKKIINSEWILTKSNMKSCCIRRNLTESLGMNLIPINLWYQITNLEIFVEYN